MDGETEHWHESFNIDLMGFVNLFAAAAPFLEKSPHASALVISSFMGREYYRSPPTCYGPLKAAQLQYVQELSQFYGSKGVRINAISPGPIMAKGGPWEYMQQTSPDWVEEQRLKIPLRRLGGPEEVANVGLVSVQPVELLYLRHERLGRRWHPRRNAVLRIGMWEDA
ncbi:MAG: hypothetical protein M1837_001033 [Sclerophora amabilis]|nr:MAG: hypothetical protein M1837_001033 [Sclerophora amabilis]